MATETDVIHMCFCRIKFLFCSVLFCSDSEFKFRWLHFLSIVDEIRDAINDPMSGTPDLLRRFV